MKTSLKDFVLFAVEKEIYIAIPVDDAGTFDSKLVFLLGKQAVKQNILFDIGQ